MKEAAALLGEVHLIIRAEVPKEFDDHFQFSAALFDRSDKRLSEVKGRATRRWDTTEITLQKEIRVPYYWGIVQEFKIVLYARGETLGSADINFSDLFPKDTKEVKITRDLVKDGEKAGVTKISAVLASRAKMVAYFKASCRSLPRKFLKSPNPYYEIYKEVRGSEFARVYRSEGVERDSNPKFGLVKIDFSDLSDGDVTRRLRFIVYDRNADKGNETIGEFTTTVAEMLDEPDDGFSFDLISPRKRAGRFVFDFFRLNRVPAFLDYLQGGLTINTCFGIDFTGSNGAVTDPKGLHHLGGPTPNQYQMAIKALGSALAPYSETQKFLAFGFGCKVNGKLSHMLPINRNPSNPACPGVQGVLQAYTDILMSGMLTFWGPTNFSPIISGVAQIAKLAQEANSLTYYTLVMITDGAITDMRKTKREIVAASHLPMSIIIVGVGDEDFSKIEELIPDGNLLRDDLGNVAARGTCRFAGFRDCNGDMQLLVAKCLQELPRQIEEYFKMRGIVPPAFA